ncbi:DNA-binding transcriptional regulator OxyR [Sulfidibacter corallicola]|uniref:DNA-binding transcriptional regulator OxyR n=1 Tax=Sulfidibacter corallicola TaxID=2818388 RepID=A0A8A4TNH0_SULCO|nr:DNA-binding transcriptional regulator OxyR [Sulfidibacter corallicola]QTD51100.1 DNA-binding transcriptional regulator OxyR [Sulfidibacter corallicola]
MNLRDLEYLVALADLRHFRKAAERCFVSQPTLSGQIKKLEQELGVQLVERHGRTVLLTEIGEAVTQRAKSIMKEVRAIEELAQWYGNPLQGNLRMGLIPTVAPYLLPIVMGPIGASLPGLTLVLREAQTEVLLNLLDVGELDLIVLAFPIEYDERGLSLELLYRESFQLAVSADHPLAARDHIQPRDLKRLEVLLLEEGHCLRDQAWEVCAANGARETDRFKATSLETLRHMVGSGYGVTLVPELAVIQQGAGSDIRYLPFGEPPPARDIGLLFRSNSSRRACYEKLGLTIQTAVKDFREHRRNPPHSQAVQGLRKS